MPSPWLKMTDRGACTGCKPGALAGSGETLLEAYGDFRLGFKAGGCLLDFAEEARDFSTFEKMVVRFFEDTDKESVSEWEAAVLEVRAGTVTSQDLNLGANGKTIRQESADLPRYVLVTCEPALRDRLHAGPGPRGVALPFPRRRRLSRFVAAVPLQRVWDMLNECAPGWTPDRRTHKYQIRYQGRLYPAFPKGEHGKQSPDIQLSHIRKLVKFFNIRKCAGNSCRSSSSSLARSWAPLPLPHRAPGSLARARIRHWQR